MEHYYCTRKRGRLRWTGHAAHIIEESEYKSLIGKPKEKFRNPEEGERPSLDDVTRQRLVKTAS
jgi:hypothetical protein